MLLADVGHNTNGTKHKSIGAITDLFCNPKHLIIIFCKKETTYA